MLKNKQKKKLFYNANIENSADAIYKMLELKKKILINHC